KHRYNEPLTHASTQALAQACTNMHAQETPARGLLHTKAILNPCRLPACCVCPMTEDILVNVTPFETRVALVEQGSVQELHLERSIERGHVGNLYLGNVARVLPGMQSAFIDIGLERAAFIHAADLRQNRQARASGEPA